jgi:K+-sensing histidine kinase KdpD
MMKEVTVVNSTKTLMNLFEEWETMDHDEAAKYVYKEGETECVYTIKKMLTTFQSKTCRTVILEDQSPQVKLAKLDEKYQNLYLASIVHDIRTPLTSITGMLDMLTSTSTNPRDQEWISVARSNCRLLEFLTYDIIDYSRIESHQFMLNNSRVSIRSLLNDTLQMLAYSFETKKLQRLMEVSEEVPQYVFIDRQRYTQILLNLLGNALKFTSHGHIKVQVDYDSYNDIVITLVRDTGIGIRNEQLPRLFKLFEKLRSEPNSNPQGVGFGLAICKKLSEAMGGSIGVSATEGMGSIFTFRVRGNVASLQPEGHHLLSPHGSDIMGNVSSQIAEGEVQVQVHIEEHYFNRPRTITDPHELPQVNRYPETE